MMKQWFVRLCWLGLFWGISTVSVAQDPTKEIADQILKAKRAHQRTPNVSEKGINEVASAYRVQKAYVRANQAFDPIAGFKACLTTQDMQQQFGINRMVFGVLFKGGDKSRSPTIPLKPCQCLTIETELGFITNKPIYKTVHSIEELKSYIGAVVPVIEIPDMAFEHEPFNAIDLAGGNGAAYCYVINRDVNWINRSLNTITVTLFYNGKTIVNQGQGRDALGDQWEALRWLVNQVIAEGWTIKAQHLLITGALGEAIPAKPGRYTARFDEGNEMSVTITE